MTSPSTRVMGLEVGMASGKLRLGTRALASHESPLVRRRNYEAIKVDRVLSSLDLCLQEHAYAPLPRWSGIEPREHLRCPPDPLLCS